MQGDLTNQVSSIAYMHTGLFTLYDTPKIVLSTVAGDISRRETSGEIVILTAETQTGTAADRQA